MAVREEAFGGSIRKKHLEEAFGGSIRRKHLKQVFKETIGNKNSEETFGDCGNTQFPNDSVTCAIEVTCDTVHSSLMYQATWLIAAPRETATIGHVHQHNAITQHDHSPLESLHWAVTSSPIG